MTRPPTAKDWVEPQTEKDWERHSKMSAKRMADHDKLPRDLRLLMHEVGELPEHQMKVILANLRRNHVSVYIGVHGEKHVIRPDRKRKAPRSDERPDVGQG